MILHHYHELRQYFTTSPGTDPDGFPAWGGTVSVPMVPFTSWSFTTPVTVSAANNANEHHWYLSQPSNSDAGKRWALQDITTPSGYQVTLALTAAGQTELTASGHSGDTMNRFLRHVYVYAFDTVLETVFCADLHQCAFAAEKFS